MSKLLVSLRFSRIYSLGPRLGFSRFSRISEDTLGSFLLRLCVIFSTKLGGVFAVSSEFRKRCLAVGFSPWRLVDGTAGGAAAQDSKLQQQQHHELFWHQHRASADEQQQHRQLQLIFWRLK